jgi:hypothetical protein
MSILSNLTSILEPSKWNNSDHKDGDDYWKNGDKDGYFRHDGNDDYSKYGNDDYSKHARHDDGPDDGRKGEHSKHADNDHSKHGNDDYSKHARHDDGPDDGRKGEQSKHADNDDHSKQARHDDGPDDGRKGDYSKHADNDDHSKHGKDYDSKHDGGWKDAKNDDCGKGDTHHNNPGEALAKFDFSHGNFGSYGDFGSHGPDHSGDMQGALASMSSDHALDYAIGQMSPADHFDIGHDDVSSHDTVHHA